MRRGYEEEGTKKGSPLDAPRREEQVQPSSPLERTERFGANHHLALSLQTPLRNLGFSEVGS